MVDPQSLFLVLCKNYNSYLDSFVKISDVKYLRNRLVCRELIKLGYRSTHKILNAEEFRILKSETWATLSPPKKFNVLFSDCMVSFDPVLHALAQRERPNQLKIISTIIFINYRLRPGFQITGFIDYEESLRRANLGLRGANDWSGIFKDRVRLQPNKTDLSFYDWHRDEVHYNNSDNYIVQYDLKHGLLFMHRGDHKHICADIVNQKFQEHCQYSIVSSRKYGEVIFLDHVVRKKI